MNDCLLLCGVSLHLSITLSLEEIARSIVVKCALVGKKQFSGHDEPIRNLKSQLCSKKMSNPRMHTVCICSNDSPSKSVSQSQQYKLIHSTLCYDSMFLKRCTELGPRGQSIGPQKADID